MYKNETQASFFITIKKKNSLLVLLLCSFCTCLVVVFALCCLCQILVFISHCSSHIIPLVLLLMLLLSRCFSWVATFLAPLFLALLHSTRCCSFHTIFFTCCCSFHIVVLSATLFTL